MRVSGLKKEKSEILVDRTFADQKVLYRKFVQKEQAEDPRVAISTIARSIVDFYERVS